MPVQLGAPLHDLRNPAAGSLPRVRVRLARPRQSVTGVDAARPRRCDPAGGELHLARHRHADLFFDTLPCTAHTTASDALWAGLPVLTCVGATFAGRVAASAVTAAGVPELIAPSVAAYEQLALDLGRTPARLRELRERLEKNRATAPLFDMAAYVRHLETAYARMWERWRAGEAPAAFAVE